MAKNQSASNHFVMMTTRHLIIFYLISYKRGRDTLKQCFYFTFVLEKDQNIQYSFILQGLKIAHTKVHNGLKLCVFNRVLQRCDLTST